MDVFFTYLFYGVAVVLLTVSLMKDRRKTLLSLKRAWNMFLNVLPQFVTILLFAGLAFAVLPQESIKLMLGEETGFPGMILSALVGAITVVPVMIAFPIVAELLKNGAGIVQMAVFISTLTTVGLFTLPMEIKYLGRKIALYRNALAFLLSFISAYLVGVLLE